MVGRDSLGRSCPNLEPGTTRVYENNGPRNGLDSGRKVGPCPGSRRRWALGSARAFSQAIHAENTYRPRFQVRTQPSDHPIPSPRLGLYKIFVHFEAVVPEWFLPLAPPHLHCPPYCNTLARLLRNVRTPPRPSFVCHTPYHIGNGNIV